MAIELPRLTSKQLKRAATLQAKIEDLGVKLSDLLGITTTTASRAVKSRSGKTAGRKMSAEARAKISAGQKARWAKRKRAMKSARNAP